MSRREFPPPPLMAPIPSSLRPFAFPSSVIEVAIAGCAKTDGLPGPTEATATLADSARKLRRLKRVFICVLHDCSCHSLTKAFVFMKLLHQIYLSMPAE